MRSAGVAVGRARVGSLQPHSVQQLLARVPARDHSPLRPHRRGSGRRARRHQAARCQGQEGRRAKVHDRRVPARLHGLLGVHRRMPDQLAYDGRRRKSAARTEGLDYCVSKVSEKPGARRPDGQGQPVLQTLARVLRRLRRFRVPKRSMRASSPSSSATACSSPRHGLPVDLGQPWLRALPIRRAPTGRVPPGRTLFEDNADLATACFVGHESVRNKVLADTQACSSRFGTTDELGTAATRMDREPHQRRRKPQGLRCLYLPARTRH